MFATGIVLGGAIAAGLLAAVEPVDISEATRDDLARLGIHELSGLVPPQLFSLDSVLSPRGFIVIVVGGFCVGFGTRYAGGCTSGHAITGLSRLSLPSLVAVLGFFAGGLLTTFFFLPLLLRVSPRRVPVWRSHREVTEPATFILWPFCSPASSSAS